MQIEQPHPTVEMLDNTAQHQEYAQDYEARFKELKDENRELMAQREV
jgi:hypothetical protein